MSPGLRPAGISAEFRPIRSQRGRWISALRGKRRWRCFSRPIGQAQAPQDNWALSSDPTLRRPALSVSAGAESLRLSAVFIMAVQTA